MVEQQTTFAVDREHHHHSATMTSSSSVNLVDLHAVKATLSVTLVLTGLYTLYLIKTTIFVFLTAILLAYLLSPLVNVIQGRLPLPAHIGKPVALVAVYCVLMALLAIMSVSVGVVVTEQATRLINKIPILLSDANAARLPLPAPLKPYGEHLLAALRSYAEEHTQEILTSVSKAGADFVSAAFSLVLVLIMPILAFYCLKDGRQITDKLIRLVAPDDATLRLITAIAADTDLLLAHYMRSLVLLSIISTASFAILFALFGVPYGLLLASICGPLEFIPILGPFVGGTLTLLISALGDFQHLGWLLFVLGLYRLFIDYVVYPYLISSSIAMHPLYVMFGVFGGEKLGGIIGAFFALPALAIFRILFRHLVLRPRARGHVDSETGVRDVSDIDSKSVDEADLLAAMPFTPQRADVRQITPHPVKGI
jgi:predicted PurR-regulated permease PerM